jgi:hypothetical protein
LVGTNRAMSSGSGTWEVPRERGRAPSRSTRPPAGVPDAAGFGASEREQTRWTARPSDLIAACRPTSGRRVPGMRKRPRGDARRQRSAAVPPRFASLRRTLCHRTRASVAAASHRCGLPGGQNSCETGFRADATAPGSSDDDARALTRGSRATRCGSRTSWLRSRRGALGDCPHRFVPLRPATGPTTSRDYTPACRLAQTSAITPRAMGGPGGAPCASARRLPPTRVPTPAAARRSSAWSCASSPDTTPGGFDGDAPDSRGRCDLVTSSCFSPAR